MKFCVSLTTIPSRIKNISKVINSLQNQTLNADQIYLNLPYNFKRFKDYKFNDKDIKDLKDQGVNISRCDDYGPATKLMGSLNEIRDNYDCVILVDDDHIYHEKTFEIFIKNFNIKKVNYSYYLNKIFNIRMGQCADGFLINTEFLNDIEKFYNKYVSNNKNLFHDDDLWFALFLYLEKKSTIENLLDVFRKETNENIVYKATLNKDIDALHQTIHKSGVFFNRRKIQKIEYIKYRIKKILN